MMTHFARRQGSAIRLPSLHIYCMAAVLMLAGSPAHAAFQYDPQVPANSVPIEPRAEPDRLLPVTAGGAVTQKMRIHASGHEMPLSAALRILVPPVYTLAPMSSDIQSRLVTFRGIARPWDVVLLEALASAGLTSRVSGTTISITAINTASNLAKPPVGAIAVEELPSPAPVKEGSDRVDASVIAPPLPSVEPPKDLRSPASIDLTRETTWTFKRGQTIRSVLNAWKVELSQNARWDTDFPNDFDWLVDHDGAIAGPFPKALTEFLLGFSASHPKPNAQISPNQIIQIVPVW